LNDECSFIMSLRRQKFGGRPTTESYHRSNRATSFANDKVEANDSR